MVLNLKLKRFISDRIHLVHKFPPPIAPVGVQKKDYKELLPSPSPLQYQWGY